MKRSRIENDLHNFIETFRRQQAQPSIMATTTRATSLHPPSPNKPYVSQSEQSYYPSTNDNPPPTERALRSLSPEDVQKLKYKIDLGLLNTTSNKFLLFL